MREGYAVNDPIADMLTRIRNASLARHSSVMVPHSKIKESIVALLKEEGFVRDFGVSKTPTHKAIKINLIYGEKSKPAITGMHRVSRPSLRTYTKHNQTPRVYGGLGVAIMSTSKGIMTGRKAWSQKVGGEVVCIVW